MATFVNDGKNIDYTPTAAVKSGDVITLGSIVCVAPRDISAGALGSLATEGVYTMPKASATVFAAGASVYWSGTTCTTVTTDAFAGVAVAAAGSGALSVNVKLGR